MVLFLNKSVLAGDGNRFEKPLIITGHQYICSLCVSVVQTTFRHLWDRDHIAVYST